MRPVRFEGVTAIGGVCSCCFATLTGAPAVRVEGDYPCGTEREYRDVLAGLPIAVAVKADPSHGYVLVCRTCVRAMARAIEETP